MEDSSTGLDLTVLPPVSQLHIHKVTTILFCGVVGFSFVVVWLVGWVLCVFVLFFPLSFVHVSLGCNLTAEMLSYSIFLYQLAQWESELDRSLQALLGTITTGTIMQLPQF